MWEDSGRIFVRDFSRRGYTTIIVINTVMFLVGIERRPQHQELVSPGFQAKIDNLLSIEIVYNALEQMACHALLILIRANFP